MPLKIARHMTKNVFFIFCTSLVYFYAWLGAGSHPDSDETKGKQGEVETDDKAEPALSDPEKTKSNHAEPKTVQKGDRECLYFILYSMCQFQ